jgi:hypothetical protein
MSTGAKPVCNFCTWAEPEYVLVQRRTVALVRRRYLNGPPNLRKCDLVERAEGSDGE